LIAEIQAFKSNELETTACAVDRFAKASAAEIRPIITKFGRRFTPQ
jgi:hypothetical protein